MGIIDCWIGSGIYKITILHGMSCSVSYEAAIGIKRYVAARVRNGDVRISKQQAVRYVIQDRINIFKIDCKHG